MTDMQTPNSEPMVDLTITIRGRVPAFALGHMFEVDGTGE